MKLDWAREDETIEDLQLGGLRLLQKKGGFRFGMDSVLLADFAEIRKTDTVADFGTGSGILILLLRGREKGQRYYGVEIQEEMAEMAERTAAMNGLTDIVTILQGDAGNATDWIPECSLDAVICNPPYGIPGSVLQSPVASRAISRSQQEDTLEKFFRSAFRTLKGRGKISLVYPAAQMLSLMTALQKNHLEPKRFRMVYPRVNQKANMALIEAVKDAKPGLHTMPPLIIYGEDGDLTNELKSVYHME